MRAIEEAIGDIELRSLVNLRHELARALLNHLRGISIDTAKPDRSARRKEIESLQSLARRLQDSYLENLTWLRREHYEASFFGANTTLLSHFEADYLQHVQGAYNIDRICAEILSVPPMGRGRVESPYLPGFFSDRPANPGTAARTDFARNLARIYQSLTGKSPAVSNEAPTPYMRFVMTAAGIFRKAYKDIGRPFGGWKPPSRDDMRTAVTQVRLTQTHTGA